VSVPRRKGEGERVELYLLRHGEAGTRAPTAAKDTERGLSAAGKEELVEVAQGMLGLGLRFDLVATSPLRRAEETALLVNKMMKRREEVEEWQELKPEGSKDAFYRRLAKLGPASTVLCVGHEPYLTTAIGEIISGEKAPGPEILLRKAGLARVTVTRFVPKIGGELRWLMTPKLIRRMA
jgi:phosphohistidine phosphatase